jgi:hypothetical protein
MKKLQLTLLMILIGGIAIALWWGFRPEPPPPRLTVRLVNITNPPTGPASASFLVSNSCNRVVRVFGPLDIEFRPPPVVPLRNLTNRPPVVLAPHQAATFQISLLGAQTWRTEFLYGYWKMDEPGMWAKEWLRMRYWLSTRGVPLTSGVPLAGKPLAPYHIYSQWVAQN